MWNKLKVRIKNKKVLASVVAGILLILVNTGVIGEEMSSKVTEAVNTVLTIGVTFGIFSDPESHIKE